ncbi:MAG: ABC transporter ATP-binding protein [Tannerellaceae bacterium]|nr:ABC transporter ATP-binding protein [Tannerellaceae bacterium]
MIGLTNVNFGYQKKKPVLRDINLLVEPGMIYGLLGKNGEGKTTLLKLMSGLLFPDSGECKVFGEMPSKRTASCLQNLFLLPEEIVLPDVSVGEYLKMYAPFYPDFDENIRLNCIESFGLSMSDSLRRMSLGQKKKVAITLALSANTPVVFMDEPTNGLDIPSKSVFRKLLGSSIRENQSVIISTHQVRDLESLIDSVIILDRGGIVLNRSLDEIGNRLDFRKVEADDTVFYSEPSPVGVVGAVLNESGEKRPVSLELLFNAAVLPGDKIRHLFNS